jgi:hypothetical protein
MCLSLGPLEDEKVLDNRYQYDTNTDLADSCLGISDPMTPETDVNLTIGNPMPSVPDPILTIESYWEIGLNQPKLPKILANLEVDIKPIPANVKVGIGDPMTSETDANLTISDPIPSVPDPNLQIELYRHRLPSVTECPRLTCVTVFSI